jgi:hypothetical protein
MIESPELLAEAKNEIVKAIDEISVRFSLDTTDQLKIIGDLLHHYLDDLREPNLP